MNPTIEIEYEVTCRLCGEVIVENVVQAYEGGTYAFAVEVCDCQEGEDFPDDVPARKVVEFEVTDVIGA